MINPGLGIYALDKKKTSATLKQMQNNLKYRCSVKFDFIHQEMTRLWNAIST